MWTSSSSATESSPSQFSTLSPNLSSNDSTLSPRRDLANYSSPRKAETLNAYLPPKKPKVPEICVIFIE